MKKIILMASFLTATTMAFSQADALTKFFDKYEGQSGFTSVNVSEKLFSLAASATPVDQADVKELVDGIKGVKVLAFENAEGNVKSKELFTEAQKLLPSASYEELMTVNSDGEQVIMLGKTASESVLEEMILLVQDEEEFVLVWINGIIDMKNISKLSEMGIDHLDELDKIENK